MKRPPEEILHLAEKAASFDLETEDGVHSFRQLALEEGIGEDTLAYYANAYESAEDSGIKALTYKIKMPENIRLEATQIIEEYLHERIPKHCPDKIWFQTQAKDNRITLSERRPYFADKTRTTTTDIAQLRYTDYDQRWHLYWKRASGKWWPYVPGKEIRTVKDCLKEISIDSHGCFWG